MKNKRTKRQWLIILPRFFFLLRSKRAKNILSIFFLAFTVLGYRNPHLQTSRNSFSLFSWTKTSNALAALFLAWSTKSPQWCGRVGTGLSRWRSFVKMALWTLQIHLPFTNQLNETVIAIGVGATKELKTKARTHEMVHTPRRLW